MQNRQLETVTASEIADFVYCREPRRLAETGDRSANQAVQQAGTLPHSAKATAERVAGGSIDLGRILIGRAILALIVLIPSVR
jgi:hypothetical protein